MRQLVPGLIFSVLCASSAMAQNAAAGACPFTSEYLSAQLGDTFKPGVPEKGMIGSGCKYTGKQASVWVDAGPKPAPTAEMWLKMSNPPGTKLTSLANDPDKAVHINAATGVSPFPSLFYERQGWFVSINVTGISDKKSVDAWNAKLAKLKRIP